ncbi:hypothetical protein ACIQ9P_33160 [Kitasatospora sp. NPDC094019]|uniref:hypothetical protein n=1 Tax=Kitasatospora sp. NPDC094019 TaxID=3364091 RepID=UPI00380C6200
MDRTAVVLLAAALVAVFALLVAAAACLLARLDGASFPAALTRGAMAFAAVLTLATALGGALGQFLR